MFFASDKGGWAEELGVGRGQRGKEKEDVGARMRHGESRTRKKRFYCVHGAIAVFFKHGAIIVFI